MPVLLHGGFKTLPAAAATAAWADFLTALCPAGTRTLLLLPWAQPAKMQPAFTRKLESRLAALFAEPPQVLVAADAQAAVPLLAQAQSVLLPGGILMPQTIREMQALLAAMPVGQRPLYWGGFSAGAYALAAAYYDARRKAVQPGGGLVEAAVCCHYGPARGAAGALLAQTRLPVHLLADGEMVQAALT